MAENQVISLEEMIRRATGGQTLERARIFRPSQVFAVLRDPFGVWCQYHAPKEEAVKEISRYDEMRMKRGIEHEQAWVDKHYPDAIRVRPDFGYAALQNTLEAMRSGVQSIYQPQLWDLEGEVYGKGDLLIREDGQGSDLGSFHYRVIEIKRAIYLREEHILQAACYNRMLGKIQGYFPDALYVALLKPEKPRRVSYQKHAPTLDQVLQSWRDLRDKPEPPEPRRPPRAAESPWRVYANRWAEESQDLVLLSGVGVRERNRLRQEGISRVDQVLDLGLQKSREILGEEKGANAYQGALAYKENRPVPRPSASLSIPRAKRHLYFDFETSDDMHPEGHHVYLIGVWDAEREEFVHFLARGAREEERIFQEFIRYVGSVESVRLYHWTAYEIRQMEQLKDRWPSLAEPIDRLIGSCVDLKEAIKKACCLPVPSYSLKCVAPALGFDWKQEGYGAMDSMVSYWEFIEGKESLFRWFLRHYGVSLWDYLEGNDSEIRKVLQYNQDDCLAMWHVDREVSRCFGM